MSNNRILSYLGLCRKAGKLVCGTDMATDAIRHGKVVLALTSSDASENTVKRISDCCKYRGVEYISLPYTCAEVGSALGKTGGIAAVCTADENFAQMIKKSLTAK